MLGAYVPAMLDVLGTVTGAAVVFAATDIDDIGVLVVASGVVAAGLLPLPDQWTPLTCWSSRP
ncbi:hypothetical protein [Micromonospora sp. DT229]|uniref:hypothetical protein n=1 Tax=Micromonospora sp. DT229 TaxID=3393430 RepID=UPI003CF3B1AA